MASHLPSLSGPASSTTSTSSSNTTSHAVGVGLVLGMVNARADVAECLEGDTIAISTLSCLMYLANTAGHSSSDSTWDVEAASVAAASARLRWPQLLQAVFEEVGEIDNFR